MNEMLDVVDEQDNVLRVAPRKEVREKALLCRASKIIVKNSKGEYLVQKRSMKKDLFPGMFGVGVGETVAAGEGYDEAAERGLYEEIGLRVKPKFLFKMLFIHSEDNEYIQAYEVVSDEKMHFNDGEVAEGRFVGEDEIKRIIDTEPFTPSSRAATKHYWAYKEGRLLDIVDEQDNLLRQATWEDMHNNKWRTRTANVFVFNSQGKIFVHKRSKNLATYPGMWDVKMGGFLNHGESYEDGAHRELKEEAGIENPKLEFLFDIVYKSENHNVNRKVFKTIHDGPFKLQEEEIEEGKFMTVEEIEDLAKKGEVSASGWSVFTELMLHG